MHETPPSADDLPTTDPDSMTEATPAPAPTPTPDDVAAAAAAPDVAADPPADPSADPAADFGADVGADRAAGEAKGDAEPTAIDAPAEPRLAARPKPTPAPPIPDLAPAACAALLVEHFPALFGKGVVLPIKLRIQADIQTRVPGVFNRKSLSIFLHRHTTGTAYIKALVNATQRFDLDGQPAGEVAAEHREAATAELARRREIVDGRRAQEREAQRARHNEQRNAARKEQQAREAAQHSAENEARRERAALLRAFESSTLTRANFCALKGIAEDTLEARLDQAWHEREARAHQPPPPPQMPRPPRRDDREGPRGPRGPRPAGKSAGGKPGVKPVR